MNNNLEIYSVLRKAIFQKATPGISYAIVGKDEEESHYLGFLNYDKKEIVQPNLLYDLASLTKVVGVTTRILQLLDQGKVNLEDKISLYLADLSYPGIKVKNLLLHNSGLPADLNNIYSYKNEHDVLTAIKNVSLEYPTGTKMVYSDLNFILLGLIIEIIDQMPLDLSLTKYVFRPLGMKSTGFNPQRPLKRFVPTEFNKERGLIRGQVHDETAYQLGGVSGNAGLFSSLEDLEKFCKMYLNKGFEIYNKRQIIPANQIENLFKYNFCGRTLGWARWAENKKFIWHTGFTGTSIGLDLERKRAFICLTNRVCPTRRNQKWNSIRRVAMTLFFNCQEKIPSR